ncbi:MAG: HAD family hydrolase [Bacteroidaceae bacterium]|nr:HAD family hydrolase [Bacteroidaceae bacterium]
MIIRLQFMSVTALQLVIFDFDGTLADTCRVIVNTLQETMRQMRLPVKDEAECTSVIGLTLEDAFRALFPEGDEGLAEECAATYRRIFEVNRKKLTPSWFPHVRETLSWLREQGCDVAVATSRSSRSLHILLAEMAETVPFSQIVGSEDVVNHKPDAEPVMRILSATGVEAENALVVGDMPVDILMGRNAGTHTCGVNFGNSSREQLLEAGADYVIDDMSELRDVVTSIG